jgi:hypothetical protein
MLLVINWNTSMEKIPEIREKFYEVIQEMFKVIAYLLELGRSLAKVVWRPETQTSFWLFFFISF